MFPTINRESSMLGFGCMRFPTTPDGKIDESEAIRMIRHAIDNGVRYIDTAYPYHGGESEVVVGKALKDGYREKVILTTKLPVWLVKTHEDMMKFLDEQLKKLDTPYVDFYILHAMNNERMDAMQKLDYKRFYAEAIAQGKVRYPGFSFHDDAKAFLRILHDWDQWGMCQVQMNILDDENQATLEGIREAGRRGVGVVVMEPLRGGLLANPPVDVKAVYDAYAVQRSPVEWGFRYLYAMPEVITILSGMSTWEQVTDNLRIFDMAKRPTLTDEEHKANIRKGIAHCKRGDVFQIVLSRRFIQRYEGDDFTLYRALRSINPSPYLFYFDFGGFRIFGSSPETHCKIEEGKATIDPIAGTTRRSGDKKTDAALTEALLADPKENAEHVMLVDLARNDLSRNCHDTHVEFYKQPQYYSHVIHLVSRVSGTLDKEADPIKTFIDTFPAGTLSGAPKVKAMQLISEIEPHNRGAYGGCIGFIGLNGDLNQAITIRTFVSRNNELWFQAGGGIVAKSDENNELQEVNNKLGALKKAILLAEKI